MFGYEVKGGHNSPKTICKKVFLSKPFVEEGGSTQPRPKECACPPNRIGSSWVGHGSGPCGLVYLIFLRVMKKKEV